LSTNLSIFFFFFFCLFVLFVQSATDPSSELHALRARVRTLEGVNEELLHAKSEFSFLTPYEHARTSR
jgi:hypothetical protein